MMDIERTPAETIEQAQRQQRALHRRMDVHKDKVHYSEKSWRTASLHPDYELQAVREHGVGLYSVNQFTRQICEFEGQWDLTGTVLLCKHCYEDGT